MTVGYLFQLVDGTTNAILDEVAFFQDLLAAVGNWSNYYHYSVPLMAAGLTVGRQYVVNLFGFKNVNVGPIALGVNFKAVTF
ncbi:hypothetical protein WT58_04170 [Burkholderia territorii]|nr:hypothetical protein WT58_04170 [Burkholderia territorii]